MQYSMLNNSFHVFVERKRVQDRGIETAEHNTEVSRNLNIRQRCWKAECKTKPPHSKSSMTWFYCNLFFLIPQTLSEKRSDCFEVISGIATLEDHIQVGVRSEVQVSRDEDQGVNG